MSLVNIDGCTTKEDKLERILDYLGDLKDALAEVVDMFEAEEAPEQNQGEEFLTEQPEENGEEPLSLMAASGEEVPETVAEGEEGDVSHQHPKRQGGDSR